MVLFLLARLFLFVVVVADQGASVNSKAVVDVIPGLFEEVGVEGEKAVEEEGLPAAALAEVAHHGKCDARVAGDDGVAVGELEVPDLKCSQKLTNACTY